MSDHIIHTTDATFKEDVLESGKPVLVDFWAPWCGPCKAIAPALEEVAGEHEDSLSVVKINIDENSKTPLEFGIRSIPTLMLFKDGSVHSQKTGAMSKQHIVEFVNEVLEL